MFIVVRVQTAVEIARHAFETTKVTGGAIKYLPQLSSQKVNEFGFSCEGLEYFDTRLFRGQLQAPFAIEVRLPKAVLAVADVAQGKASTNTHQEHNSGQDSSGRNTESHVVEQIRSALQDLRSEGIQGWLSALSSLAKASEEPIEVFMAHAVPGCWLRTRLRVTGHELNARTTLRPVPRALSSTMVRSQGAMPGCILDAKAHLHPDGHLSDLELAASTQDLPCLHPELAQALGQLPELPSEQLEALSRREPLATVHWMASQLRQLRAVALDETHPPAKFGVQPPLVPGNHPRFELRFGDCGTPTLTPPSAGMPANWDSDLRRLQTIMAFVLDQNTQGPRQTVAVPSTPSAGARSRKARPGATSAPARSKRPAVGARLGLKPTLPNKTSAIALRRVT